MLGVRPVSFFCPARGVGVAGGGVLAAYLSPVRNVFVQLTDVCVVALLFAERLRGGYAWF